MESTREAASQRAMERILEAAERCIGEKGYQGATLQDIAEEAGVSKALVHYHFHSCEPVLCELLPFFERDEARHVGLGVQYLPSALRGIGVAGLTKVTAYEVQLIYWELEALADMEQALGVLGIKAQELVRVGFKKQLQANDMMWDAFGRKDRPISKLISRAITTACEARFPPDDARGSLLARAKAAAKVWRAGGYAVQDAPQHS
jgi:AcrR family transcriptional regulator